MINLDESLPVAEPTNTPRDATRRQPLGVKRGTGILNNHTYIGEVVWNRSTWKRSASDSKLRRWQMNDANELVTHQDERLRIVPQDLWLAVKNRQRSIEGLTVRMRGVLKRNGRLPRHLLSGLLKCDVCGGAFRRVNGREYGCASYKDVGIAACTNGIRVRSEVAERKLLDKLAAEMLSPEGVAFVERKVREHLRAQSRAPKALPKREAAQATKKSAEIAQLRALMKAGTLSEAVANAAIEKAEEELQALERMQPAQEEKQTARIIRMLPRAADVLRERIGAGNLGLRDPRSIIQGRNTLFAMFNGKVPMVPAKTKPGERPYLVARVALNRLVLLEAAASAAGCLQSGSGGRI